MAYPRPIITDDFGFLYDSFAIGKVCVHECEGCHRIAHPPSPMCPECNGMSWQVREVSGRGLVHSYTVHHYPPIPPFETPHPMVLADMEEGFRFFAAAPAIALEVLRIGLPVELRMVQLEEGLSLPFFYSPDKAPGLGAGQ